MAGSGVSDFIEGVSVPATEMPEARVARPTGGCELSEAELCAVLQHQRTLAEARGVEVSYEEALEDWQKHHAIKWREERQRQYLTLQREEIQRYKWIESEKARRDLGAQAVLDWIGNYAESWRAWYEREHGENLS
jgi:dsRNA-specific ribonuclease